MTPFSLFITVILGALTPIQPLLWSLERCYTRRPQIYIDLKKPHISDGIRHLALTLYTPSTRGCSMIGHRDPHAGTGVMGRPMTAQDRKKWGLKAVGLAAMRRAALTGIAYAGDIDPKAIRAYCHELGTYDPQACMGGPQGSWTTALNALVRYEHGEYTDEDLIPVVKASLARYRDWF